MYSLPALVWCLSYTSIMVVATEMSGQTRAISEVEMAMFDDGAWQQWELKGPRRTSRLGIRSLLMIPQISLTSWKGVNVHTLDHSY